MPKHGAFVAFVDPTLSLRDAPVVWLPPPDRPVLVAHADRSGSPADADFRLEAFSAPVLVYVDAARRQHVIIKSERGQITICVRGAPVAVAPARVTFEFVGFAGLFAAHRTVATLLDVRATDLDTATDAHPWTPTQLELRDALIALDAHGADASHRDVAKIIFGPDQVESEWVADGCELKDYVRRCRSRGVRYMQGGYRSLLR